jgi:hypothetical protein
MFIFDPKAEWFTVFRLPYPLPFYTRGLDGRIDDARAGWKGRGLAAKSIGELSRSGCRASRFTPFVCRSIGRRRRGRRASACSP